MLRDLLLNSGKEFILPLPTNTGPGPKTLIGETPEDNKGFFGETTPEELISGNALATKIGLTAGTNAADIDDIPWLKFFIDDTVLFVAKRHFKGNLTWDDINAVNAIDGSQTLIIDEYQYKIRLMQGIGPDAVSPWTRTYDDPATWGSEWNRLMYNLLPAYSSSYPQTSQVGEDWVNYNPTDIDAFPGTTIHTSICQEWWNGQIGNGSRVVRGYYSLSSLGMWGDSDLSVHFGWRPVLELIQ